MSLPHSTEEKIVTALQHAGLNRSEIEVFLLLLQNESGQRVSQLARKTKINRTTLYAILHSLIEYGLVSSVEERGVLIYHSVQPGVLVDYIQRTQQQLMIDIQNIRESIPILMQARARRRGRFPSIQFFEGKEGMKQAYEDSTTNNPSKVIVGFTGSEAVFHSESIEPDWVNYYVNRRVREGVHFYSIATGTEASHRMKELDEKSLRTTKLLPQGYTFNIEVEIYENKVIIASYSKDHPLAVLIEDERIAETMKTLFRYIDSTLPA